MLKLRFPVPRNSPLRVRDLFLFVLLPGVGIGDCLAETVLTGRLVIVGGALNRQNEAIYQSLLEGAGADAPIAVVPLASGVPEESGPLSVGGIQQYATNPDRVFDTRLTHSEPEKAALPAIAERLEKSGAIWFTGGDQSRIVAALRPETGDTLCYAAVRKVLSNGGVVGGSSAGAAMMSDPMIRSGDSDKAMLFGATDQIDGPGVCVGRGMGLFPYGLSDQHFLQRGRFGRLLIAMEATENRLGFGVSENSALVVDLKSGMLRVIGDRGVTIIDRNSGVKDGHTRDNIRVHLLGDGDSYDAESHLVSAMPGKTLITADSSENPLKPNEEPNEESATIIEDIWGRNGLPKIISTLISHPTVPIKSNDGAFDYVLTADDETQFYRSDGKDLESTCVVNMRLDITARLDIEQRIEAGARRGRRASDQ